MCGGATKVDWHCRSHVRADPPLHFLPWISWGVHLRNRPLTHAVTSRPISTSKEDTPSFLVWGQGIRAPLYPIQGRGRDQTTTMLSEVRSVDGPSLGGNARRRRNKRKRSSEGKKNWDRTLPSTAHMLNCCARSLRCAQILPFKLLKSKKQLRTRRHSARRRTQP